VKSPAQKEKRVNTITQKHGCNFYKLATQDKQIKISDYVLPFIKNKITREKQIIPTQRSSKELPQIWLELPTKNHTKGAYRQTVKVPVTD